MSNKKIKEGRIVPRRGFIAKRDVLPDPIYNSKVVTKLVNNIMLDGKKSVAQKIVYDAFDIIKEKEGKNPLEVFEAALENVMPVLEVKARRVGGATYQVPLEIRPERRQTLGLRWIVSYARNRHEKTMAEKLAGELIDAVNGNGGAFKKKEDHSDDEYEYEARFGRYAYSGAGYIEDKADSTKRISYDNNTQGSHRKIKTDDILAEFDDEDDDEEYDDSFLYRTSDKAEDKVDIDSDMEAAAAKEEDTADVQDAEPEVTEPEEQKAEPEVAESEEQKAEPEVAEPEEQKAEPEVAESEETEWVSTEVEPTLVDEEPAPIEIEELATKQAESGVKILGRIYR